MSHVSIENTRRQGYNRRQPLEILHEYAFTSRRFYVILLSRKHSWVAVDNSMWDLSWHWSPERSCGKIFTWCQRKRMRSRAGWTSEETASYWTSGGMLQYLFHHCENGFLCDSMPNDVQLMSPWYERSKSWTCDWPDNPWGGPLFYAKTTAAGCYQRHKNWTQSVGANLEPLLHAILPRRGCGKKRSHIHGAGWRWPWMWKWGFPFMESVFTASQPGRHFKIRLGTAPSREWQLLSVNPSPDMKFQHKWSNEKQLWFIFRGLDCSLSG